MLRSTGTIIGNALLIADKIKVSVGIHLSSPHIFKIEQAKLKQSWTVIVIKETYA